MHSTENRLQARARHTRSHALSTCEAMFSAASSDVASSSAEPAADEASEVFGTTLLGDGASGGKKKPHKQPSQPNSSAEDL